MYMYNINREALVQYQREVRHCTAKKYRRKKSGFPQFDFSIILPHQYNYSHE